MGMWFCDRYRGYPAKVTWSNLQNFNTNTTELQGEFWRRVVFGRRLTGLKKRKEKNTTNVGGKNMMWIWWNVGIGFNKEIRRIVPNALTWPMGGRAYDIHRTKLRSKQKWKKNTFGTYLMEKLSVNRDDNNVFLEI